MPAKLTIQSRRSVFVAVFAAIICVSGFVAVPAGPLGVPIVLQNMMVVLSGLILGGAQGGAAVGLYITAGMCGLPVFAGGKSGIATLTGPTGGFIIGYFVGSLAAGLYLKRPSSADSAPTKKHIRRVFLAALINFAVIYLLGVGHMVSKIGLSFPQALTAGVLPFLPGDAVKLAIAVPLAVKLRPVVARYISTEDDDPEPDE